MHHGVNIRPDGGDREQERGRDPLMAKILVVDDLRVNRKLVVAYLQEEGYGFVEAESGERALELAAETKPDLILLDVMMPGMSGFETARKLKEQSPDAHVPIIFVSALDDRAARLSGLQIGADEYLTKPIDRVELLVRVRNLLALRARERALQRRNVELVELCRFRDEMSALLVHDLKNPLGVIMANASFLADSLSDPEHLEALGDARTAAQRILRLIANLQDLTNIEAERMVLQQAPVRPAEVLAEVLAPRRQARTSRGIELATACDEELEILADRDLVTRVIENIVDNAMRYTPRAGRIEVSCRAAAERGRIRVGNSGPPIPVDARPLVFEKFGRASSQVGRTNLGLGLYFCRLALEAHGGRIWIDESPALPTIFEMELALA
jgi:signal transduction histidine kinase